MLNTIFTSLEVWLESLGAGAYVVAPVVMAVVSILPVPAEAPAMVNGMLFGPVAGTLVTWTGAMAGAWLSYEIARRWGRPLACRFVRGDVLARIDQTAAQAGWWGLLVLRFVPIVAFTALNWGAGLSDVPRWRFVWTTALGIIPGVVVFTSSGVGLGALWRRSPSLAVATLTVIVFGSIVWSLRRREPRPVG